MNDISLASLKRLAVVTPGPTSPREFVAMVEAALREFAPAVIETTAAPSASAVTPQPVPGMYEPTPAEQHAPPPPEPPSPRAAPPVAQPERRTPPLFTEAEVQTIFSEREKGSSWDKIGAMLGRSAGGCQTKYYTQRRKAQAPKVSAAGMKSSTSPRSTPPFAAPVAPPADDATPRGMSSRVASIVAALSALDDSFSRVADEMLINARYKGADWDMIAHDLGCDADAAKARWRRIIGCKSVANTGGIVTAAGWADLKEAARIVAAQAA